MVTVRKFKVLLPWGNDNKNTPENVVELPFTLQIEEKFAYSITQTSLREVVVIIHSGEKSDNTDRWCKTRIFKFTLNNSQPSEAYTFSGEDEIDLNRESDWQEWMYSRKINPSSSSDPVAEEYRKEIYNSATTPLNQPVLDPDSSDYLNHQPYTKTLKQTREGETINAFDYRDTIKSEMLEHIRSSNVNKKFNTTKKAGSTDPAEIEGLDKPVRVLGSGIRETTWNGAKYRILGVSTLLV